MTSQQENFTKKAKKTGRRIIDGLFGNRSNKQEEARLGCYESICQEAAAPAARLISKLRELISQDEDSQRRMLYADMNDDATLLKNLLGQLNAEGNVQWADNATTDTMPYDIEIQPDAQKKPVVVVVLSDADMCKYLKAALDTHYYIYTYRNGWEALVQAYRIKCDAIVADTALDIMEGLTLCARLKGNPLTKAVPVIMLADSNEQRLLMLQQGADAVLTKPVDAAVVDISIHNLLSVRRQVLLAYEQSQMILQQGLPEEKRRISTNDRLMERVRNTIEKYLNDSSFSVNMIADEVGISRAHLHRKMKELTGQTPHEFIRQLRLEMAARLLATQEKNITEVVYACGFPNAASFSTLFKTTYGMTPTEFMTESKKSADSYKWQNQ
ncbi:MAG: helix-turn-helix domain-containing protein [Prevotella sp.]|nr:helix-turn-helix domain-containing protein [Prevotella sp.]